MVHLRSLVVVSSMPRQHWTSNPTQAGMSLLRLLVSHKNKKMATTAVRVSLSGRVLLCVGALSMLVTPAKLCVGVQLLLLLLPDAAESSLSPCGLLHHCETQIPTAADGKSERERDEYFNSRGIPVADFVVWYWVNDA